MTAVQNTSSAIANLCEVVAAQIAAGLMPGAQLVVARSGETLLDIALGNTGGEKSVPVTSDTLYYSWSVAKPITAIAIHQLIERGKLTLDTPVVSVWPEFGAHGKDKVTVGQILAHRAGFPITPPALKWYQYADMGAASKAVADAELSFAPGTAIQYHALTFGWALGEIVRRVDGRPIEEFARAEIFAPLRMHNSYLKLPEAELPRAALLFAADDYADGKQAIRAWNTPQLRLGIMPAAGLHTTARDMARFYQAMLNGGTLDGVQVCTQESITRAITPSFTPGERELETELPAHFGFGFHLGGYPESGWGGKRSTTRTFGHNGWATNMTFADLDRDVLCIFLNNGMIADLDNHARMRAISDVVLDACGDLNVMGNG